MANHYTNPLRKVSNRKIMRNQLKAQAGSNHIKDAWKNSQIKKYGFVEYIKMRFAKTSRNQRQALKV
jgi:hypothetical protein